jgi:AraC-like DNA-binding protein
LRTGAATTARSRGFAFRSARPRDAVIYREDPVRPALASRIECIWLAEDGAARAGPAEQILPDGCVEWIIHLGAAYARIGDDGRASVQPASFVVGPMSRPIAIAPTGPVRTLGVRFRPGGAREALGAPLDVLADTAATTEELWGADGRRIEDAVGNAADDAGRRDAIQDFLDARLARSRTGDPRLASAVHEVLAGRGRRPVSEIARRAGWGRRQLERAFRAGVGVTPKALSRVIRFQNLLRLAGRRPRAAWADLAARCGYADQAHLVREFRELAGVTPASGQAASGELGRHFIAPERLDALLSGRARTDDAFVQDGARPRA